MNPTEQINSEYAKIWIANNKPIPSYEVTNEINDYDPKNKNKYYHPVSYEVIDNKKIVQYGGSGKVLIIRINNNYKLLNTANNFESDIVIPKLHDILYDKEQFDIEYKLSDSITYELIKSELNEIDFLIYDDLQCDVNELEETLVNLCKIKGTLGYGGNKCYINRSSNGNANTDNNQNTLNNQNTATNIHTVTNIKTKPTSFADALSSLSTPIVNISTRLNNTYKNTDLFDYLEKNNNQKKEIQDSVEPYLKTRLDNFAPLDDSIYNKTKIVINKSLFYNKLFFNGTIACNITPDILSKYFKELQEIKTLNVKLSNPLSDSLATLFKNDIFDTYELFVESVNNLITNATDRCPNLFEIKKYIENTFEINDNPDNRIQFTNILNNVNKGLCVPMKFHEMMKKSLPLVLMELGLNKKRYSNGFYWYGMVEKPKEEPKNSPMFDKLNEYNIEYKDIPIDVMLKYVTTKRNESIKKTPEEYRKEALTKTEEKYEELRKRYPSKEQSTNKEEQSEA